MQLKQLFASSIYPVAGALALLGAGCGGGIVPIGHEAFLSYTNPVWSGYCADPHVIKYQGMYYAYGTHVRHAEAAGIKAPDLKERKFVLLRSPNLVNWECLGGALIPYAGGEKVECWAPEVVRARGKFWMYYSAAEPGGPGWYQHLRVAVSDSPEGPFRDCGKWLFPDKEFTIDPDPFQDPKDGQWYLYFSKDTLTGRAGTGNWVVKLDGDMVTPVGKPVSVVLPSADWEISIRNHTIYGRHFDAWHTVEGSHVVFRDGKYYQFYSGGAWVNDTYGLSYAVADHPLGTWLDAGATRGACVLKGVPGIFGTGHNSVVLAPDGKTFICAYHACDDQHIARQLCIDPIEWTPDGPHVTPTRTGGRLPVASPAVHGAVSGVK
jgi:GH43 family beta-xylosidase